MELARPIELAPKNGDFVVLQDGWSGSWEVGRWAPESSSWVQIDGKPLRISPTHWVSISDHAAGSENTEGLLFLDPADQVTEPPQKRLRTRFILAFTVAAIFIGWYAAFDYGFTRADPAKDSSFDKFVLSPAGLKREDQADVAIRNPAPAHEQIALQVRHDHPIQESNAVSGLTGVISNTQNPDQLTARTPASSETRSAPISAAPGDLTVEPLRLPARSLQPQPKSAISSADEARLVARAEFLIKQSDFSGARLLLEHALEKGSARAAFMMAETYDWRMLRTMQARGVRGDAKKAQELYELAAAAGIEKARERLAMLKSSSPSETPNTRESSR